jgi:uncharacterized membrane protein
LLPVPASKLKSAPCRPVFSKQKRMQEKFLKPVSAQTWRGVQRNILAGIITVGPLLVTYLIFSFLAGILAKVGLPIVWLLAAIFPGDWINQPWLQYLLAVVLTLVVLYVVGRVTSQVVGEQALRIFEGALDRLPFVAKIYKSVRKLIDTMMAKDDSVQRVVLVEFPMPGQRALGFLTRTLVDSTSGQVLAAVLLPNAINPTSGLLQIMPLARVTETSLTMEQAMSMLMTGGTVGPEAILFTRPAAAAERFTELIPAEAEVVEAVADAHAVAFADLETTPPGGPDQPGKGSPLAEMASPIPDWKPL